MKKLLLLISVFCGFNSAVRSQIITTVAGGGTAGGFLGGDGGPATAANISHCFQISFDSLGCFYFGGNYSGFVVRKVDPMGIIHTVAGNGTTGYSGDGGPATDAEIENVTCKSDAKGNIYICDHYNSRIRKVDAATGVINTIIGNGTASSTGDGGPASAATVLTPFDVCFDRFGNMYISEYCRVRKVDTFGIITTIAGNGTNAYTGDGGPATAAELSGGYMSIDRDGNLLVAGANIIRIINLSTGIINYFSGDGFAYPFNGDDINADSAHYVVDGLSCDMDGNVYITDYTNSRVRVIDTNHIIHTIAGTGVNGFSGDGGPSTAAQISDAEGVAVDGCGNVYIADGGNFRIRKITFDSGCSVRPEGIVQTSCNNNITLTPNPATQVLTITSPQAMRNIVLTDYLGRAVLRVACGGQRQELDVSALPPGLYVARMELADGEVVVRKVVKE